MGKILLTVILLVLVPISGYCKSEKHPAKAPVKSRLNEIKRHIKEKRQEIKISKQKALAILNEIDSIDKQNAGIESKIGALNTEKTNLTKEINTTQNKIASINASIAAKKNIIGKRLVASFKLQQTGYLQLMLASDSPVDMEKRYTFMGYIIRHDEQEEKEYRAEAEFLAEEQKKYADQKSRLDAVTDNLNKQRTDLMRARMQKTEMLADIRRSTQATRKVLLELQGSEEKLQHTLKSLEGTSGLQTGFASMEGKLPFPVRGRIERIFGKSTDSIINAKGVLFVVQSDAPIKAVYPGVVVWSEWLKGYGNTIILDHGDRYFTIYAHVGDTDAKIGDEVKAGQLIGKVGDAGLGREKTLYFEIRHGEKPLNPEEWLASR